MSHGRTASHAHRITSRDDDDVFLSHHNNEHKKSYFRLQPLVDTFSPIQQPHSLSLCDVENYSNTCDDEFILLVYEGRREKRKQGENLCRAIIISSQKCSFVHFCRAQFTLTSSGFIFLSHVAPYV